MPPPLQVSSEAQEIHAQTWMLDLHCDLLLPSHFFGYRWDKAHTPNPLPKAALFGHCDVPRMRQGNIGATLLGVVTNPFWPRELGHRALRRAFDDLEAKVAARPSDLGIPKDVDDLLAMRKDGRIACMASLEGVHSLGTDLDLLEELRRRGLWSAGFVHFTANEAGRPMVGVGQGESSGLTAFGFALLERMNELGLIVDVAHLNKPGVLEACKHSRAPLIASHTAALAVTRSPRGLDDEQIRAIADTGGVVGIMFVEAFIGGGIEAVVAHLDHLRKLVGVSHAAIGTDWEGFALFARELDGADKLPALTEALLRAGWKPDEILAVYQTNTLRVFREVQAAGVR